MHKSPCMKQLREKQKQDGMEIGKFKLTPSIQPLNNPCTSPCMKQLRKMTRTVWKGNWEMQLWKCRHGTGMGLVGMHGTRYITQRRGALRRCFHLCEQSGRVCRGTVGAGNAAEEHLLWHPPPPHSRLPGLDPEVWEQEEGRRG